MPSPTDAERKRIAQLSDDDTYLDVHGLSRGAALDPPANREVLWWVVCRISWDWWKEYITPPKDES